MAPSADAEPSEESWTASQPSSSNLGSGGAAADAQVLVRRTVSVGREDFWRFKSSSKHREGQIQQETWCVPVAHPSSQWYSWWALGMLLLDLSYTAVVCPVSIAFGPREVVVSWAFIVDFVAGLLFFCDLVLSFNVGYLVLHGFHQHVVMERRAIARLYMRKGTFLVDMLSSLAWFAQLVVLIIAWSGSDPNGKVELAHALRIARILRILRVAHLLKRLYLSNMSGSKQRLGMRPSTLHILQLLYVGLIIVNFCGCLWFFVAHEQDFKDSWVSHYHVFVHKYSADGTSPLTADEVESIPNRVKYMASAYWASTTILTVGYGDITPWNTLELAVCMAVQLLGICFFGALLTSIAGLIQHASKAARRGAALQEKLESIQRYMRVAGVPREVRRRIKRYYGEVWVAAQDELDVAAFYAELPHVLRTDMAWSIAVRALNRIACFRAIHGATAALRAICSRLEPLQLPPGFTLCEEGEEAIACWILQEGEVCLTSHTEGVEQAGEGELVRGPDLLGEAALLGAAHGFPCHLNTITTRSRCKLWRLSAHSFAAALRLWPQAMHTVQGVLLHGDPLPPSRQASGLSDGRKLGPSSGSEEQCVHVFVEACTREASQPVLASADA